MKIWGKVILFLIIVVPIIFCYSTIKSLWSEEDIVSNNQEEKNNTEYQDMENAINNSTENNETVQTFAGETFTSKIGNPISKISEGGEINISVANVYQEADEKSEVVGTLKKYTTVTSQGYPEGWSRIKAENENMSGWVLTKYITLSEGSENNSIVNLKGSTATVNVTSLNVRAAATVSGKLINSLTEGTEVKITDVSDDEEWCKITWQTIEGWVMKEYLTIK